MTLYKDISCEGQCYQLQNNILVHSSPEKHDDVLAKTLSLLKWQSMPFSAHVPILY